MADVTIEHVRKSFGRTEVLKGVSAAIPHGRMMVILGPSGCGKSTLLRLVAGLERIDAGEIRIGDRLVNDLEPMDRDIAMVFQNYALYPHMSVFDNMAYGLKNRGVARSEIERKVKETAAILGLADFLARKPRQLSGGQRQRVAMGRAIVREPSAFLFDEPLSNLDTKLRVQMRLEIKQLQQRIDTTGIYVTHDQVEAMTLGDQLMVMNDGLIEQIGAPLEVYENPASTFVGGFLGSPPMNFIPATVADAGNAVHCGETSFAIPGRAPPGRAVLIGIRAEHLDAAEPGCGDGLAAEVISREALGADTILYARTAAQSEIAMRLPGIADVGAGTRLCLPLAPHHLHLFDATTGKRLDMGTGEALPGMIA